MALQPDGKVLVGGAITGFGGRDNLVRLNPDGSTDASFAPPQVSNWVGGTTVTWQRGGSSPELAAAPLLFRSTNDGGTWSRLGSMRRVTGGWQASGLQPVINHPYLLRAEGLVLSDEGGSQGRIRGHGAFYFSDGIFESGFESQPSH